MSSFIIIGATLKRSTIPREPCFNNGNNIGLSEKISDISNFGILGGVIVYNFSNNLDNLFI